MIRPAIPEPCFQVGRDRWARRRLAIPQPHLIAAGNGPYGCRLSHNSVVKFQNHRGFVSPLYHSHAPSSFRNRNG